jgi:hypothetical protein
MKPPARTGTICEIRWSDEGTPERVEEYVVGVAQTSPEKTDIEHLFVTVELRGGPQIVALQLDEPTARCVFFLAHEVAKLRKEVDDFRRCGVVVSDIENTAVLEIAMIAGADLDIARIEINKWIREHARTIPADRVLGEGQVAVDREDLENLIQRMRGIRALRGKARCMPIVMNFIGRIIQQLDALHAKPSQEPTNPGDKTCPTN